MPAPRVALLVVMPLVAAASAGPLFAQGGRRGAVPGGHVPTAAVAAIVNGRIVGRITDRSGAPLAGITLTVTGAGLAQPRTVTSDGDGRFDVSGLPAGQLSVTCAASGFLQWRREVAVTAGTATTLDVIMRRTSDVTAAPAPHPVPVERGQGAVPPAPPAPVVLPPAPPPPPATAPGTAAPQPEETTSSTAPDESAAPPQVPTHRLLDEIEDYLGQLDEGSIAFNAPDRMRAGDTAEMHLVLSPLLSVDALKKRLAGLPGEVQGAVIKIAPRMEARLTGADFDITAITPEQQAVARDEPTEWRWDVTARTGGTHRLHLAVDVTIDGTSRTLRTFDRTIVVNVAWTQRLSQFGSDNWQWLWAVVVAPVGGWIWRRRRRGRKSSSSANVG